MPTRTLLLVTALLMLTPSVTRPALAAADDFVDNGASLVGAGYGATAWGDVDADGNLDLLLTGDDGTNADTAVPVTALYLNNGNGSFSPAPAASMQAVPDVFASAAAWGDADNDGDLDLLLTGDDGSSANPDVGAPVAHIYLNDGQGAFSEGAATLTPVSAGAVAWGDADNDGDQDIVLTGYDVESNLVGKLYLNDGHGAFTSSSATIEGTAQGAVAWGDVDTDGDLDLLVTGYNSDYLGVARLYRNNGAGAFSLTAATIEGVYDSSVAFGDADNDADLDLLLSGLNNQAQPVTRVYRNDGGFSFQPFAVPAGRIALPDIAHGSVAWGDADNDGDVDALLSGEGISGGAVNGVYLNDGAGGFVNSGTALPPVAYSSAAWGDANKDGRLDIAMAGYDYVDGGTRSDVYVRNIASAGAPAANAAPTAPAGLAESLTPTSARLSWNAASDTQTTDADGLTYNLRVGTTPGGSEVMASQATGAGVRLLPRLGATDHRRTWTLNQLTPGTTYYWSVQAVDTAFAGSTFATERSFVAPLPAVRFATTTLAPLESATSVAVQVLLSAPSPQTVTVNLATGGGTATAGADYQAVNQTVTFAPGQTAQTLRIPITDDALDENNEWLGLTLTTPAGASLGTPNTTSITIRDNDVVPSIAIADFGAPERQSGTTTRLLRLTLSAPSGRTVAVRYATANGTAVAGQDYVAQGAVLEFAPGQTSKTIGTPVMGDTLHEGNETVLVNLSRPVNATLADAQAILTIRNDDAAPVISFADITVPERDSGVFTRTLTLSLSAPSGTTVSVRYVTSNGTAVAGKDYRAQSGILTFAPGRQIARIALPIIGDVALEPAETFVVNFWRPVNATLPDTQAVVTIGNDD